MKNTGCKVSSKKVIRRELEPMKSSLYKKRVELIGNEITLLLGLIFLGNFFELWSFDPFDGWWVLFLYIPAICGFLTKGITTGGILLTLTAVALTIGMVTDLDERVWAVALILYLAFISGKSLCNKWREDELSKMIQEAKGHDEV